MKTNRYLSVTRGPDEVDWLATAIREIPNVDLSTLTLTPWPEQTNDEQYAWRIGYDVRHGQA